ncbi:MAG: hypothetical protein ACI9JL_000094 [Paracoccaceae bacterium]
MVARGFRFEKAFSGFDDQLDRTGHPIMLMRWIAVMRRVSRPEELSQQEQDRNNARRLCNAVSSHQRIMTHGVSQNG